MKMAALQLMQQKANKDTKTDTPAITEASETATENNADTNQSQTTASDSPKAPEVSTDGTSQADNSTCADSEENSPKPATNGPLDPTATQNGECKSPLEGKKLEESIPGLAQAKELAETLVAEDGSGMGTSKNTPKKQSWDSSGRVTRVDNCLEKKLNLIRK